MTPKLSSTTPIQRVTVQHLDTKEIVSWADGIYQGDPGLVSLTQNIVSEGLPIQLGPHTCPVSDTARGVAAAALAACCGRGLITSASFTSLTPPHPGDDTETAPDAEIGETTTVV